MTRGVLLVVLLTACTGKSSPSDSASTTLPAIDTLKPVTASDTLQVARDSSALARPGTVSSTPVTTPRDSISRSPQPVARPRDSAFRPRRLPQLDTVPTKRPPR